MGAVQKYTRTAMALHWLIALGMIINIILVWLVDSVPDGAVRPMIDTHKSIGITVLGLGVLRLLWRLAHRPPPLPAHYPRWERHAAHAVHIMLYALIFALPISGWLHDSAWKAAAENPMALFGLVPWPRIGFIMALDPDTRETLHGLFGQIHSVFGYALYGLFALHVAGALKHEFWDKEPELRRMLPG